MSAKPPRIPDDPQQWITASKRHSLSHVHVHMARELGMNPRKLGNHDQEPLETAAAGRLACRTSLLLTPRSRFSGTPSLSDTDSLRRSFE
jgi:hypothetical protein